MKRVTGADRVAAAAVVLGVIAMFVPWYTYSTSAARVSVNGFRASILGEVFFLALALTALIVLTRMRVIDDALLPAWDRRQLLLACAAVAGAAVLLQLLLDVITHGRGIAAGFLLAILAAATLVTAVWLQQQHAEPRRTVRRMLEEDRLD